MSRDVVVNIIGPTADWLNAMERLKRTFSMRKKRDTNIESNKPHQWQEDERKVREGSCSFQVKV